jgi:hypothetical protein
MVKSQVARPPSRVRGGITHSAEQVGRVLSPHPSESSAEPLPEVKNTSTQIVRNGVAGVWAANVRTVGVDEVDVRLAGCFWPSGSTYSRGVFRLAHHTPATRWFPPFPLGLQDLALHGLYRR